MKEYVYDWTGSLKAVGDVSRKLFRLADHSDYFNLDLILCSDVVIVESERRIKEMCCEIRFRCENCSELNSIEHVILALSISERGVYD